MTHKCEGKEACDFYTVHSSCLYVSCYLARTLGQNHKTTDEIAGSVSKYSNANVPHVALYCPFKCDLNQTTEHIIVSGVIS